MKNFFKSTQNLFRVFFAVFLVSLTLSIFQIPNLFMTEVKSSGGTISEGVVGTPRFINPVLAQSQADLDLTRLVFSPLVRVDQEKNIYYELAESVKISEDGLVYTITLKDDVLFSDGTKMSSDDVIYTIEKIQDPLIKSPLYNKWQGVQAQKIDEKKLTITLSQVFNDFIYNLELGVLPKHIWEPVSEEEFIFSIYNSHPIGTGPYTVKDMQETKEGTPEKYTLSRNTHYIHETYIQEIVLYFYETSEDQMRALKKGIITSAYGISPERMYDINIDKYSINSNKLPRIFSLFLNPKKQIHLTLNIRSAIDKLIDKQKIIDEVFVGYATPTSSPLGTEDRPLGPSSREEAHALIQLDGWQRNAAGIYTKRFTNNVEEELHFSISVPNLEETEAIAEHIQNQLREEGIVVTIKSYDENTLNQEVIRTRDFESLLFGYELEKPSDLFAFWHSSQINDPGLNIALLEDSILDAKLTELRTNGKGSIAEIEKIITEKKHVVFLYSPSFIYLTPKNISPYFEKITQSHDRFNKIPLWFKNTHHVWNFFIK